MPVPAPVTMAVFSVRAVIAVILMSLEEASGIANGG